MVSNRGILLSMSHHFLGVPQPSPTCSGQQGLAWDSVRMKKVISAHDPGVHEPQSEVICAISSKQ